MSLSKLERIAAGPAAACFGAVWLLFGYAAPPAAADCAGSSAVDECLVGEWRSDGSGVAEWMKRNLPSGISIPQSGGGTIAFSADGTYRSTGSGESVQAASAGSSVEGRAAATNETRGRWAATDGRLHLCPEVQETKGELRIKGPDGTEHVIPMPKEASATQMTQAYTCAHEGLETQITVPGIADPMTIQYERTGS